MTPLNAGSLAAAPEISGQAGVDPVGAERELRLPLTQWSPRIARRFVAARLSGNARTHDIAASASLVASELVSNAVQHGGTCPQNIIRVRVEQTDVEVRIEVADRGGGRIALRPASPWSESGRGLALINRLSDYWGVDEHEGERRVWCAFRLA